MSELQIVTDWKQYFALFRTQSESCLKSGKSIIFATVIPDIRIEDYSYPLPDERIAKYPLPERDSSKLLIYEDGLVRERIFSDLPSELPDGAFMVFNDTKVVPARLHFRRDSGAHIEIF